MSSVLRPNLATSAAETSLATTVRGTDSNSCGSRTRLVRLSSASALHPEMPFPIPNARRLRESGGDLDIACFVDAAEDIVGQRAVTRLQHVVCIAVAVEIVEQTTSRAIVDGQQQIQHGNFQVVGDAERGAMAGYVERPYC